MVGFPTKIPDGCNLRAAFYRAKADEAHERARRAISTEARAVFLQIAESYTNLASAVEDIARKRSSDSP
jgi:hypothetical protein